MVCIDWNEDIPSSAPRWFLSSVVFVLDQFSADPAITPIPLLSRCGDTLPPQGFLNYQSDEKRILVRDRDRLRNDPQWVHDFLSCCSWMFTERLEKKSELVGSEKTRQILTVHPRHQTVSYWFLLRVFKLLSLRSLQKIGRCILVPFHHQACSMTDYPWYSQVLLSKLLPVSSYSSKLPWYWGKSFVSGEDWIEVLFCNPKWWSPVIMREKSLNKYKQSMI